VESENGSRDHLREDDVGKVAYVYMTLNLGDDVDEPWSREAKSLKIYIDRRFKYKNSHNL
jgi:hypothetical protein